MSRPTRGSRVVLPVRACHPLRSAVPDASGSPRATTGLVPVRSPLLRESRLMSFPPGTEMVQFPGFASPAHGFDRRYRSCGGLPHSEIRGSPGARPSPRLIAACHVLRRLSAPRHPPDALLSLAPPQPRNPEGSREPERPSIPCQRSTTTGKPPAAAAPDRARPNDAHGRSRPSSRCPRKPSPTAQPRRIGHPRPRRAGLVGPGRIERPTSPLSGVRSDLLSYGPGPAADPGPKPETDARTGRDVRTAAHGPPRDPGRPGTLERR